ncbi:61 kDa protein [Blackcurrant-associated closterovirus 1]|uniref:61 kDa protein n=1 Tax=Blackcurrant closterovirus 1 TaxID=2734344 RepID=A0A385L378_9CLOS|nr:61 kDa protein [Blackcurrant-associated closterovirus 1]AYA22227.1 61 kDa protein [Blackcurrant-associated closterovirus 1]
MTQTAPSYYWGDLFKVFYGAEESNEFLSKAEANFDSNVLTWNHKKNNGTEVSKAHMLEATGNTILRELCLLHFSVHLNGIARLCGVRVSSALKGIECYTTEDLKPIPLVNINSKFEAGCKFSLNAVGQHITDRPFGSGKAYVQHFWALSNSAGVLIGPKDVLKYKATVFKDTLGSKEKVEIVTKLKSYLAFCVSTYRNDYLSKSNDERLVAEPVMNWIRSYYSTTTLNVDPIENPLLTGMFLEFISKYTVFDTSFKKNVKHVTQFVSEYAPLISEIWEYEGRAKTQDARLIVGLRADDFCRNMNSLSLEDMEVTLGKSVVALELVIGERLMEEIEEMVDALLFESNPTVEYSHRWIGFFVYYGIHRTSKSRVDPRPEYIDVVLSEKYSIRVHMSKVEDFFNTCQRWNPRINVRRSFNGRKSNVAFEIFRRLNLRFPPLVEMKMQTNMGYLNIDYYKQVIFDGLNNEEMAYLCSVRKKVDLKLGAKISLLPKRKPTRNGRITLLERERKRSDNAHAKITRISKSLISLGDL